MYGCVCVWMWCMYERESVLMGHAGESGKERVNGG